MTSPAVTPENIHTFWFGTDADDARVAEQQAAMWWAKDEAVDEDIRRRFGGTLEAAVAGELNSWETSPRGVLALVLVTDQFSRTIHRDRPQAFASDPIALAWARSAVDAGVDGDLRPIERVFLYLPFEHAESMADQDRAVNLFQSLLEHVPPPHRPTFRGYLDFAVQHRDVIARFGRFPHRNRVLGRTTTDAERVFLSQPGSSF